MIFTEVEEILDYVNLDLEEVVTPVNIPMLAEYLEASGYNHEKSRFLLDGFTNGFDIGYRGEKRIQRRSPNLELRVGNGVILWNKVMKEVKLKRYAGPFSEIPFEFYIQSPIGLVPKDNHDMRLIFHLSYPKSDKNLSVNGCTPAELTSVKYPDFSRAIELCMAAGIGCYVGRSDWRSAFRQLGLSKGSWYLMVMKAKSPMDGKWYFFVDKCLPFGAAISCSHFQEFSNAIAFVIEWKTSRPLVN